MTRELLCSWVTLPVYRGTTPWEEKEGGVGEGRERERGRRGRRRGGRGEGRGGEGGRGYGEKLSDSVQNVAGVIKV